MYIHCKGLATLLAYEYMQVLVLVLAWYLVPVLSQTVSSSTKRVPLMATFTRHSPILQHVELHSFSTLPFKSTYASFMQTSGSQHINNTGSLSSFVRLWWVEAHPCWIKWLTSDYHMAITQATIWRLPETTVNSTTIYWFEGESMRGTNMYVVWINSVPHKPQEGCN